MPALSTRRCWQGWGDRVIDRSEWDRPKIKPVRPERVEAPLVLSTVKIRTVRRQAQQERIWGGRYAGRTPPFVVRRTRIASPVGACHAAGTSDTAFFRPSPPPVSSPPMRFFPPLPRPRPPP